MVNGACRVIPLGLLTREAVAIESRLQEQGPIDDETNGIGAHVLGSIKIRRVVLVHVVGDVVQVVRTLSSVPVFFIPFPAVPLGTPAVAVPVLFHVSTQVVGIHGWLAICHDNDEVFLAPVFDGAVILI